MAGADAVAMYARIWAFATFWVHKAADVGPLHETAFKAARQALQEGDFGIHSWQWTTETFVHQVSLLHRLGLIPLRIRPGSVVPTRLNGLEFMLELEWGGTRHARRHRARR